MESSAQTVYKVSNGVIATLAGSRLHYGFSGDNGPAIDAALAGPSAVAVDNSGNVYIADSGNNRIRKVTNGVITTVAGNGLYYSESDSPVATSVSFGIPIGVTVDASGNLYIALISTNNIRKVSNGMVTTVAGSGSYGFSGDNGPAIDASLSLPAAVAVDPSGSIYIADSENNRIRKVSNGIITTVGGMGACCFGGDNGPASAAQLSAPAALAVDPAGSLYIGDYGNKLIRKVSKGVITTVAGGGSQVLYSGPATGASLAAPSGLAVDSAGNFYFADTQSHRVLQVSNGVLSTIAGNGEPGFSGDNGPATSASLTHPTDLAVDSAGNLYISDQSNRVRKVTNGVITTVAGTGKIGFSGDSGPATSATFRGPAGLAVDTSGNLYIVDVMNLCVRKVSNGIITTVAGDHSNGFTRGDNEPATTVPLRWPEGIAVDSAGNLYIADRASELIRKVSNGVITTVAGNGTEGFSGDNGVANTASISYPLGIAVDSSFNVYFSDSYNERVRVLVPSGPVCFPASVSSTSLSVPAEGGNVTVSVTAGASCPWAVQSLPSWVLNFGNSVAAGPASMRLAVDGNSGPARSGTFSLAGVSVTVTQEGGYRGPLISPNGIVPLDSTVPIIQPGSWISIFGNGLASGAFVWNGDFPTSLGGVSVTVNNKPGYLSYVSPTQINLQAPDDSVTGNVNVVVTTGGATAAWPVTLAPYAPSLSLLDNRYPAALIPTPDGSGAYGNGAYDIAGPAGHFSFNTRPVVPGETIELFGVGFGPTNPPVPAGRAFSGAAPATTPVTVTIGGHPANVEFFGITNTGVYQLNVDVPEWVASGDQLLSVTVGGAEIQKNLYLNVK